MGAAREWAMDLDKILKVAVRGGASDVVIKTGVVPRFRFNGDLVSLADGQPVTAEIMQSWVAAVTPAHLTQRLKASGDADFAIQTSSGHRFRVNVFKQRQAYGMVLRVIHSHVRTMEELQLPAIFGQIAAERRGLVLVTGATGSGKTTTLAALIQKINTERAAHIITIEDPIEYNYRDERSTINQREIGTDTESFPLALRAALRQNPDVILVGELRDRETVETALMAAETGHLVLSTMHTIDAAESLTRALGYFEPHQHPSVRHMLASTLRAVISQRLVPRVDGKGLVAAHEVMLGNASVRDVILNGGSFLMLQNLIANGRDTYGMMTFDDSLFALYQNHIISRKEALAQASHRDNMLLRMQGVSSTNGP